MDEISFKIFYEKTSRNLWWYIYRISGDKSYVDDVLQESYIRIIRSIPEGLNDKQQTAYLYKTATNLIYDQARKSKSELKRFDLFNKNHNNEEFQNKIKDPSLNNEPDYHLKMDFEYAFNKLPVKDKSLLWMAYVESYQHKEIATLLNIKEKSVKVLLSRAKNRLAKILENLKLEPEKIK
jgi:RNA polymerase sigma-70 factor (ECF subfamily)